MRERMTLLVAVFAALAVGCDGSLASPDGSLASPASSPAFPDWSPLCPATAPAIGSSCTDATLSLGASDQLMCEYGYAPWSLGCATLVECAGGQWGSATGLGLVCTPDASAPASLPADCPPVFALAQQGAVCAVQWESCAYDQAHECVCLSNELGNDNDLPDPHNEWTCAESDPACPPVRPRLGSSCSGSEEGGGFTTCQYDGPLESGEEVGGGGIALQCVGGVWAL